jgi:hypothetical protein
MKVNLSWLMLAAFMFFSVVGFAQTQTNVEELNRLAKEFNEEYQAAKERVETYTAAHKVPTSFTTEDGRYLEMVDVVDGRPVYNVTHSHGAAITTRAAELWPGGSTGYNINGDGYDKLGQWDAGVARMTHQEFNNGGTNRVNNMDGSATHFHGTNVAGVMVAGGVVDAAKGSAYAAELKMWNWNNENSELASAAASGLEVSNHSWGRLAGWDINTGSWEWYGIESISPDEDFKFGYYSTESRQMDQIAYNAPNLLIVRSTGNDRGEGPNQGTPENDGGSDGFDCIHHFAMGKNVLSVGAVKQVDEYTGPESVRMTDFSCWGPADDGRIKPDIVGKGEGVYTTNSASNTSYTTTQGTSFSSPNVAASASLLQQYYQTFSGGNPMKASTLKGLILHTADEAGPDDGPDYMYGWGLMNTKRAAQLITDGQGQNSMEERVLSQGDTYQRTVTVPEGATELRVSLCWTDPAGIPRPYSLNDRTPMIVNDLDLEIYNGSGTWYPYSLDPENPSNAATAYAKNNVDIYEQVYIANPDPGTYTIAVSHDGDLDGGSQAYSLIITGIEEYTEAPLCVSGISTPGDGADDILLNEWIGWEPAPYATSYDLYFGTDGGGTVTPTNVYNGENVNTNGFTYLMDPSTTYYLQIVPRNNVGIATGCDVIYSFTTMDAISTYPFEDKFADVDEPELPFGYQSVNLSDGVWQSTEFIGNGNSKSMICFNEDIVNTDFDNWLISPPFVVEDGMEYAISCDYKSFTGGTPEAITLYWSDSPYKEDFDEVLFSNPNFSGNPWKTGLGMARPDEDGIIFVAFHVHSDGGFGVLMDNFKIENWGPVSTGLEQEMEKAHIFSHDGRVMIKAGESWKNADVSIVNLMGQEVFRGSYTGDMQVSLKQMAQTGLFVVTLKKGDQTRTEKVMIR